MKTFYLVHGRDGSPTKDRFPRLQEQLEGQGHFVVNCAMPHPEAPSIDDWINILNEQVEALDETVFFVGHSVGCQTILRYLAQVTEGIAGGCSFVAPWFDLLPACLPDEESKAIAQPRITTPIDFEAVKKRCPQFEARFSDNDPCVAVTEKEKFETLLNATTYILHDKGHFSADTGVEELPELLNVL